MKIKFILLLASPLLTLVSCGGDNPITPVDPPKEHIEEILELYKGYYSYRSNKHINEGTTCKFTATIPQDNKYVYFGMCQYEDVKPYFEIGYNDSSKKVNITNVYKDDGTEIKALEYGSGKDIHKYGSDLIYVDNTIFKSNNKIIVECTITQDLDNGLWAYVGIQ